MIRQGNVSLHESPCVQADTKALQMDNNTDGSWW